MRKPKRPPDTSGYKTEAQLKEEALLRAEQQAKIDALKPPPSPKKKKADNFWYHYKWHTIAGVAVLALVAFFFRDVVLSTDPDATILFTTRTPVAQETLDALQIALEAVAPDGNGDGKVSILIDYIYLAPAQDTQSVSDGQAAEGMLAAESDYASTMKLATVVAAGVDNLFLVDQGMVAHFEQMMLESDVDEAGNVTRAEPQGDEIYHMFETLDLPGAEGPLLAVSATALAEAPGCEALADFYFALRPVLNEKKPASHNYGLDLLHSLTYP